LCTVGSQFLYEFLFLDVLSVEVGEVEFVEVVSSYLSFCFLMWRVLKKR